MRSQLFCVVAGAAAVMLCATSPLAAEEKVFEDFKCKVALPGSQYQWLDGSKIPNSVGVFGDGSGLIVSLTANKTPDGFAIKDSFVADFDAGFMQPGVITKISGAIIKFRGVPCYQFHARLVQNNTIATVRAFAANGYLYQMQVIGSPLPVERRDTLEPLFNSFDFTTPPRVPAAAVATPAAPAPGENSEFEISRYMGRIAGVLLIAALVLFLVKKAMKKGPKKA